MCLLLTRLVHDDSGQDLVEYALLTAVIGLASAAAWSLVSAALHGTYSAWNVAINDLWEPPNPGQ